METTLSPRQILPVVAGSIVGIALSSLTHSPFGILVPMTALFLFASGRTTLFVYVVSATGIVGLLLVLLHYEGDTWDFAATWAEFLVLAICIGVLVATYRSVSSGAEVGPAVIRSSTDTQAPPYPGIEPSLREKVTPRYLPVVSLTARDDRATAALLLSVSFWGGRPFHFRYWRRQPDGRLCWVESRSEPFPDPSGTGLWRANTAEIDDQRSGTALPTKVAINPPSDDDTVRAAKIVENLLGNAWAFDAAGRPTYLTPFAQTFVAVSLEEFQAVVDEGHTFFKCTAHPDDYDRISALWRRCLQTGDPFFLHRRIKRATGNYEWSRTGFVPARDAHGRITGWYGATIDLDPHRITLAELRDRERELSQLVNMVPSLIWRLTPDGEPVFFNSRMVQFTGLDIADADKRGIGRLDAVIEATHPDDAVEFSKVLAAGLATGQTFAMRYRLRRTDGVFRWMDFRAEPLRDQESNIVQWYGASVDIDDEMRAQADLRRMQERLAQASQAASLAELSASIAHEVNQPLAAVVANSHACLRWLTADPPNLQRAQTTVERVIRDANGAADVVARTRALFKQNVKVRSESSLTQVIADAKRWVSDLAHRHGVTLDSRVEPGLPTVAIDPVQIQQVLINLMRNAIEAMAKSPGVKTLGVRASRDGDAVRIEVRDTGPGVEDAEKIFGAFFTTKDGGMGMGLAVSRSIVESHAGRIWAENNSHGGASFILTLPIEASMAT